VNDTGSESPRRSSYMGSPNGEVGNGRTPDRKVASSRFATNASSNEESRNNSSGSQSRPSSNSPPACSTTKPRRAPALSDKKINPDFFKKLEVKGPDDWPVEIAVRDAAPPAAESPGQFSDEAEEVKVDIVRRSGEFGRNGSGNGSARGFTSDGQGNGGHLKQGRSGNGETQDSHVWRRGEFTDMHQRGGSKPGIGSYDGKGMGGNVNVRNNPIPEMEANPWMQPKERDADSWESSGQALSPSSSATYEDDGPAVSSMDEWTSVQKQLQLLEFQQRNHLKMFQVAYTMSLKFNLHIFSLAAS
jgi:hypothetical protein